MCVHVALTLCSLYLAPRSSVLMFEGMEVGCMRRESPLVTKGLTHSCHCPGGVMGKEHPSSFSPDPRFSRTLSSPLTMGCEITRRSGGWRKRKRGDGYL